PCDSGPDSCYGVSGYLSVVGVIHQMINSKFVEPDEIRVNITHQQNRLIPGGEEQANVGVYHNKKATLSGSTELDRAKMIKMVEKIPSCAQLKVLELRDCSKDKHCGNGLFINDWSN
ncbi:MAG: hypothetical protein ACXVA9_01910, partial [Bdellovibrionales bacterium]